MQIVIWQLIGTAFERLAQPRLSQHGPHVPSHAARTGLLTRGHRHIRYPMCYLTIFAPNTAVGFPGIASFPDLTLTCTCLIANGFPYGLQELYYYPKNTVQVTVVGEGIKKELLEQGGLQVSRCWCKHLTAIVAALPLCSAITPSAHHATQRTMCTGGVHQTISLSRFKIVKRNERKSQDANCRMCVSSD